MQGINSFAAIVSELTVFKSLQLSNGDLLFLKLAYSIYIVRKPRMTKQGQSVRGHTTLTFLYYGQDYGSEDEDEDSQRSGPGSVTSGRGSVTSGHGSVTSGHGSMSSSRSSAVTFSLPAPSLTIPEVSKRLMKIRISISDGKNLSRLGS